MLISAATGFCSFFASSAAWSSSWATALVTASALISVIASATVFGQTFVRKTRACACRQGRRRTRTLKTNVPTASAIIGASLEVRGLLVGQRINCNRKPRTTAGSRVPPVLEIQGAAAGAGPITWISGVSRSHGVRATL